MEQKRKTTTMTAAEGRKFGLTVGGAFLVFAAISWWRGHTVADLVLGTVGTLLVLAGVLLPTRLGPVERAWMAMALAISKVTTPIVMGVLYGLVLSPAGFLRRSLGGNPLVHAEHDKSYWRERKPGARRSASMQRQF